MNKYINYIQAGINNAQQAEAHEAEVRGVLSELNSELSSMSDGKLSVSLDEGNSVFAAIRAFAYPGSEKSTSKLGDYRLILTSDRGGEKKRYVIASWDQKQQIYPVKLTFGDTISFCSSKEELISSLQQLFSQPSIGKIINDELTFTSQG